jgi:isoleucyl-tRNA synthetase
MQRGWFIGRYEQLMPFIALSKPENAFRVISEILLQSMTGTHTPTFGADDAKVAKEATPEFHVGFG